jgi:hypothetical protein
MDEEGLIYFAMCGVFVFLLIIFSSSFGGVTGIICLMIAVFALIGLCMMNWADFILFPFLTSIFNVTFQPAKGYRIPPKQDAIVKNVGGLFYATGFLTASLLAYTFKEEGVQDNEDQQLMNAPERWERAIAALNFAFKFHVLSAGRDVQKVREEIEGKRSYQEFQLSRAQQNTGTTDTVITEINRKINVIQSRMDRISRGEKPIAALMYMETTAFGVSEKAALDALGGQMRQLQVAFSSFDISLQRIVGRELYMLFKFNFMLPTTLEEMSTSFDSQG